MTKLIVAEARYHLGREWRQCLGVLAFFSFILGAHNAVDCAARVCGLH